MTMERRTQISEEEKSIWGDSHFRSIIYEDIEITKKDEYIVLENRSVNQE